jgi:hypothetical protein
LTYFPNIAKKTKNQESKNIDEKTVKIMNEPTTKLTKNDTKQSLKYLKLMKQSIN